MTPIDKGLNVRKVDVPPPGLGQAQTSQPLPAIERRGMGDDIDDRRSFHLLSPNPVQPQVACKKQKERGQKKDNPVGRENPPYSSAEILEHAQAFAVTVLSGRGDAVP